MVLESTVVCVDNSEYMRNGDFVPSRLHAQQDAVNLVCQSKTRSNPENNVGLITLSDETEVLVTLTTDVARVLSKLHQASPKGNINFLCGIKVAHLVLKHRQGKNHKMRIIAFVASPIPDVDKELVKYGKRLRKEKVNVDVVNFGEEQANTEKLTSFINAINGSDSVSGSHLVTVPPGPLLSDTLMTSPILVGEDGQAVVRGGGGSFEFGIDPNEDPELALALRVSMEEQRAEQEARRNLSKSPTVPVQAESSEEALLKQALEMSMQVDEATPASTATTAATATPAATKAATTSAAAATTATSAPPAATTTTTPVSSSGGGRDLGAMTEEEQIAYALQMSMEVQDAPPSSSSKQEAMEEEDDDDVAEAINDPDFLRAVLQSLPGVDADSDAVKKAVEDLKKKKEEEEEEKKKNNKK